MPKNFKKVNQTKQMKYLTLQQSDFSKIFTQMCV